MPELPDILLYLEHLERRLAGATLLSARVADPNLLRTVEPPLETAVGCRAVGVGRVGKRVVLRMERDLALVLHLMIAGRLHWKLAGAQPARGASAWFAFSTGTLVLTEAGSHKRAALHVVRGEAALHALDPGGLEVLESTREQFRAALVVENHTLKRALCDPRLLSGIGNAYSDEILHRARLSPMRLTQRLNDQEIAELFEATRGVLSEWTERLRREAGDEFPRRVTAFRAGMAVHGRYRQPCPRCGAAVQRIAYRDNETNYCARCQTGGRVLADRALSRLLRRDWPATLEELEGRR
jgi:formamidopyrimidine-DNA glycosylase